MLHFFDPIQNVDTVTIPYQSINADGKKNVHNDDSPENSVADEGVHYDTSAHKNINTGQNATNLRYRSDLHQVEEQRPHILQYKYCERSGFFQPNIQQTNQVQNLPTRKRAIRHKEIEYSLKSRSQTL